MKRDKVHSLLCKIINYESTLQSWGGLTGIPSVIGEHGAILPGVRTCLVMSHLTVDLCCVNSVDILKCLVSSDTLLAH